MLRNAGREKEVGELEKLLQEHVAVIRKNSVLYPPHEVRFEQTIVTPALAILSAYYKLLAPAPELLEEADCHAKILERFDGHQPDYRLNEIPIRHWDGYWFGKRRLYGDTFPHYWSCLTARAFMLYAGISGKTEYRRRAERCLRNCLCLFLPDGSASCAYLYPYSVTMLQQDGTEIAPPRRGEFFDPFANDQDWALYFSLVLKP